MKYLYLTFLGILLVLQIKAQDFQQSIGTRLGLRSGVAFKKFITDERALNILMTFQGGGTQITMLRQFHQPMFLDISNNIFVYYGYGAHLGYSLIGSSGIVFNGINYSERKLSVLAGIDGNMGIEYRFLKNPVSLCLDYKPYFELDTHQLFRGSYIDIALTISYTF